METHAFLGSRGVSGDRSVLAMEFAFNRRWRAPPRWHLVLRWIDGYFAVAESWSLGAGSDRLVSHFRSVFMASVVRPGILCTDLD